LAERLLQLILTTGGALVLVFFLMRVVPGDPAAAMLGTSASPEAVAGLRAQLGLDRPLLQQFVDYLAGLAQLDLGRSLALRTPVATLLWQALIPTILLTVGGTLVSLLVGVPLGIVAALRRGTWIDYLASVVALLGVSVPVFVWGVLLLLVFALHWPLLPSGGAGSTPVDVVKALVLPSIATGLFQAGLVTRITRSSLIGVMGQDYVRTARAKGLAPWVVTNRHVVRNGLIPVITIVGLNVGTLFGGTIVVESIFARPGLGRLMLDAISARDYPVIQGIVIVSVVFVVVMNLLIDVLYTAVDPRVRA
jgi:ABC-type dipeptide/oligopeptide/nickel transport system permease component